MKNLNLKNNLGNILAPLRRWRDRDPAKIALHPYRDWRRLVIGWLACLALVLVAAAYTELGIKYLVLSAENKLATLTAPDLSENLLRQTRDLLEKRQQNFKTLSESAPTLADPAR